MEPPIDGINPSKWPENGPEIDIFTRLPSSGQNQADTVQEALNKSHAVVKRVKNPPSPKIQKVPLLEPNHLIQQAKQEIDIRKLKGYKKQCAEQISLYQKKLEETKTSYDRNLSKIKAEQSNELFTETYKSSMDDNLEKIEIIIKDFTKQKKELSQRIKDIGKQTPLVATKIKKGSLAAVGHAISKFVKKLLANMFPDSQELTRLNDVLGKHLSISEDDFLDIKNVLQNENFNATLKMINHNIELNSMKILNDLIYQSNRIRDFQINRFENATSALNVDSIIDKRNGDDVVKLSIAEILKNGENLITTAKLLSKDQYKNDKEMKTLLLKAIKLLNALIENAVPHTTQLAFDNLYPKTVIKDAIALSDQHPFLNSIKTSSESGKIFRLSESKKKNKNGFLLPEFGNLANKADWTKMIMQKTRNKKDSGVFVSGFRRVRLRTPDGHQVESGAMFDLLPLEAKLDKKQVALIFYYASIYADIGENIPKNKNGFPILDETIPDLTDNQKTRINELNEIIKAIGLTQEQNAKLIKIVHIFHQDLVNAVTRAFISAGHKQPKST